MAESTKIAWTHSTFNPWMLFPEAFAALQFSHVANAIRFEVPQFMTWMAEGHAVVHSESKLRMRRHRLFVVRSKIAAALIAAISALVAITLKHCITPSDVFGLPAQAEIALESSVSVGVVIGSARSAGPSYLGNLLARFRGMFFTDPPFVPFRSRAYGCFGRVCVFLAFEQRRLAGLEKMLGRWVRVPRACKAFFPHAIQPRFVDLKLRAVFPQITAIATVQPRRAAIQKVLKGESSSARRQFQCASECSSHG